MEAERSSVFDSLGINPQLFVNEILNSVDDALDEAFGFFLQQQVGVVGSGGGEKAEALAQGVESIRNLVQGALQKKLGTWEKYCTSRVFEVPEGFTLPKANESAKDLSHEVEMSDPDLDNELDSLRRKLTAAGKEQVELQREMSLLEKKSNFSTDFDASVAKTLALFDDNSTQEAYKDIMKKLPKLHQKLLELRNESNGDAQHLISGPSCSNKEYSTRSEEMQDILSILRNE
ncbi:hypothetical protein LUZ60_016273 [Juncus effusus]|nr:hypothetical protein LUZ60_016273 [Juncus effusus]